MLRRLMNRACPTESRFLEVLVAPHDCRLCLPSARIAPQAALIQFPPYRHTFKNAAGLAARLSLVAVALVGGFFAFSCEARAQHQTVRFFTTYGSPRELSEVAFSPTNDYVAVAVKGGPVMIIATRTGDVTQKFDYDPFTMCWSADGKHMLAVGERATKLLNITNGSISDVQWQVPNGYIGCRYKNEAGKLLVDAVLEGGPAAESQKIQVGDELIATVLSGKVESMLGKTVTDAVKEMAGPAGIPVTQRILPKGSTRPVDVTLRRKAATVHGNQLQFRETRAGSSPQACVIGSQNSLVVIDANTGSVVSVLSPEHVSLWGRHALSPDGQRLAKLGNRITVKSGEPNLGLEILDVRQQTSVCFAPYEGSQPKTMRFSGDGRRVFIGDYDRVEIFDLELTQFLNPIILGSNQPDPEGYEEPLIDVRPDLGQSFKRSRIRSNSRILNSCDVALDGRILAVGSAHGQCLIWSPERRECLAQFGEEVKEFDLVEHTRVSPNGHWVAYFVNGTLNIVSIEEHRGEAVVHSDERG